MRAIRNGKLYDTDTAKLIASVHYPMNNVCDHWSVSLYRKKNGEFFLYHYDVRATNYGEHVEANSITAREVIKPVTKGFAMAWAEEHMSIDEYIAEFGEVYE